MPTYTLKNKKTGETKDIFCSYADKQKQLEADPEWVSVLSTPATISQAGSTLSRTGSDWKDLLGTIKKGAGGNSEVAIKHGVSKRNTIHD